MLEASTTSSPQGLSHSLQLTSFVLSVIGAAIGGGLALIKLTEWARIAKLDIRLTRDSFFRLIDKGEVFFCIATLLAREGPVLIKDVEVTLSKIDGAKKIFPLDIVYVGEVIAGNSLFADHRFFGSSTLTYLSHDKPLRAVYVCGQKEYKTRQIQLIDAFNREVLEIKNGIVNSALEGELGDNNQAALTQIQALVDRHLDRMFELVQIESGRYEVELDIKYQSSASRFGNRRKIYSAKSSMKFFMPTDIRDSLKVSLRETLRSLASNTIFQTSDFISWPTSSPADFEEL